MRYLRLAGKFAQASAQDELAYRANFWISLLHSLLNLGTGVLGLLVLFGQVETIHGWDLPSTLALLGVFLTLSALRGLFLGLGLGVLALAMIQLGASLAPLQLASFLLTLAAGITILYAILLAFAALTLWNPGFLFTWLFDGLFQMARYPVGLYPGWLRLVLTWVVPVGVMTTVPAQALAGDLSTELLAGSVVMALALLAGASNLFRLGLRRYASASS
jgi:ABC-2 type transport system permease protein